MEASFKLSLFVIQLTYLVFRLDWNLISVNGKRILKLSSFNCLIIKFTEPWRKFISELWECCPRTCTSASANHLVRWKIRKPLCKTRSGWDFIHCYVYAACSVSLPMRKYVTWYSDSLFCKISWWVKLNYFIRNKCESHDPFLIRCLLYSVGLLWHDNIYSWSPVKKEDA